MSDDVAALRAELEASRRMQEAMAAQLAKLSDMSRVATTASEDHGDEIKAMRDSLAMLASSLEDEKRKATEAEEKRRAEEDKVNTLRAQVEQSRRALMQLQSSHSRSSSSHSRTASTEFLTRQGSVGNVVPALPDTAPRRKSLLAQSSADEPSTSRPRPTHRRGSSALGYNRSDSLLLENFEQKPASSQRIRRRSSIAVPGEAEGLFATDGSIVEDVNDDLPSNPPSAPLRGAGRKQSVAVFDNLPPRRRSSIVPLGAGFAFPPPQKPLPSAPAARTPRESKHVISDEESRLRMEITGLRIRLAEAEEARRASDGCLKALKDFVAQNNGTPAEGVQLPPLPTDVIPEDKPLQRRPSMASSLWNVRLPSLARRQSSVASNASERDNFTTIPKRRMSTLSMASTSSYRTAAASSAASTPSIPPLAMNGPSSFGHFSFAACRSVDGEGEQSPRTPAPISLQDSDVESLAASETPSLTCTDSEASTSRSSSPVDDDRDDNIQLAGEQDLHVVELLSKRSQHLPEIGPLAFS